MSEIRVEIAPGITIGDGCKLAVISGPCVIEGLEMCLEIGRKMQAVCAELGLQYVFKASFDKANRTSVQSFRGPGLEAGLEILAEVKRQLNVPVTTDVHECAQVAAVAAVADILQIPAFLCRQTDLLVACGETGRTVNVKKGQMVAPEGMKHAVAKVRSTGNNSVFLTERGSTFGYGNLVVDMRGLRIMRDFGVPVCFDATHSVQLPGGQGQTTGGQREYAPVLMNAALAVGVDAVFMETHPSPDTAKSDGPNAIALADMQAVLRRGKAIHELA